MEITDEQKGTITEWVQKGEDLSTIQSRLKDELGINLTYVDTRFLLADLGLELIDEAEVEDRAASPEIEDAPGESAEEATEDQHAGDTTESAPADEHSSGASGEVSVTVDALTQPGAMISGKVTFSDGECATWHIDQTGRPRLDPATEGYHPSEEDLTKLLAELQKAIR